MRARCLVLMIVALLAAGCTSTSRPHGARSSARSATASAPAPTTSASGGTSSEPTTSEPDFPPPEFARARVDTAIGDPVTADLCAAVGLATFGHLGTLTASFDARQFPPGCSVTITTAAGSTFAVSVYAARRPAPSSADRTTRVSSHQTIYAYSFHAATGSCRRAMVADHIKLMVDSFAAGTEKISQSVACAATDAMADGLAAAVAHHSVPRLSLAARSLSEIAACPVLKEAGVTALTAFASGALIRRGFDENCEVKTKRVFLFVNFAIADDRKPAGSTITTVLGHRLYELESGTGFCSYVSTQGSTDDGRYEQVAAAATAADAAKPPAGLCAQTAEALARYLDTAGLT